MAGIDHYPSLIGFLKEIGHYEERYKAECLSEEPANHNTVIGLEIYRLLSSRSPEEIKISYGRIFRQPAEKAELSASMSTQDIEDILREDVVLKILECRPANYADAYKKDDGHLRLGDFSNCFNGTDSKYSAWVQRLKSQVGARKLIENDEKNRVKQAVNRNKTKLKKFLELLKSEQDPLPEWGIKLEKNLQEYGFKP